MNPAKESGKKRVHPVQDQIQLESPGDRVSDATASQIEPELRARSPIKVFEDDSGRPIGVTLPTIQNTESSSDPMSDKPLVSPTPSDAVVNSAVDAFRL